MNTLKKAEDEKDVNATTIYEDLFAELARRNVEIRILPSLWPLRDAVVDSTVNFSIVRMRNALPR